MVLNIRLNDMLDGNEYTANELEKKLSVIENKKFGIIKSIRRTLNFNDEPKLSHYIAEPMINNYGTCSGTALNEKRARLKAICEMIERHCLSIVDKNITIESYSNLKHALDPFSIAGVAQQDKNKSFSYNKETKFAWVKGTSLTKMMNVWLPAQLVYVPYYRKEPIIRHPITTGAASGTSYSAAIYRGLCEIIERDAFMITYLNKLPRCLINISSIKNKNIKTLDKAFRRYNLERYSFDITTDIKVPVILTILIDRTGIGPSVSLGMKCSFNVEDALLGSMEEAQQTRPWVREEMQRYIMNKKIPAKYRYFLERGFFWYNTNMIKNLNFLIKTKNKISINKMKSIKFKNSNQRLKHIINIMNKYEICVVDITTKKLKKIGFRVIKVIVPELQPLYLIEKNKYWGGERLYEVPKILRYRKNNSTYNKLNKTPHPFL